ncbi:hypothetical protein OTU49_015394, partial [Cherax quadricarinatus]
MAGHDEAADLWLAANFLTGRLYQNTNTPLATADLGGGTLRVTIPLSGPPEYIRKAIEKKRQERQKQGEGEGRHESRRQKLGGSGEQSDSVKRNISSTLGLFSISRSSNYQSREASSGGVRASENHGTSSTGVHIGGNHHTSSGSVRMSDNRASVVMEEVRSATGSVSGGVMRGGVRSATGRVTGEGQVREVRMMRGQQEAREPEIAKEAEQEEAKAGGKNKVEDSERESSQEVPMNVTNSNTSDSHKQLRQVNRHVSGEEIPKPKESLQTSEVRHGTYKEFRIQDHFTNSSADAFQDKNTQGRGERRMIEDNRGTGSDLRGPLPVDGEETSVGLTPGLARVQEGEEAKRGETEQKGTLGKAEEEKRKQDPRKRSDKHKDSNENDSKRLQSDKLKKSREQEDQHSNEEGAHTRRRGSASSLHVNTSETIIQQQISSMKFLGTAQDKKMTRVADDSIVSHTYTRTSHSHPGGRRPRTHPSSSRRRRQRKHRKRQKKMNQKKPKRRKHINSTYTATMQTLLPEVDLKNKSIDSLRSPSSVIPLATGELLNANPGGPGRGSVEDNHGFDEISISQSTTPVMQSREAQPHLPGNPVTGPDANSVRKGADTLNRNHTERSLESSRTSWKDKRKKHRKDHRRGSQERETIHEMSSKTLKPSRERQSDGVITGRALPNSDEAGQGDIAAGNEDEDIREARKQEISFESVTMKKIMNVATVTKKDRNVNKNNKNRKVKHEKNSKQRRKYGFQGRRRTQAVTRKERQQRINRWRHGVITRERQIPVTLNSAHIRTPQEINTKPRAKVRKRLDGAIRRRISRRGSVRNSSLETPTINSNNEHYSLNPSRVVAPGQTDHVTQPSSGILGSKTIESKNKFRSFKKKDRKYEDKSSLRIQWRVLGSQIRGIPPSDTITKSSDHPVRSETARNPRHARHYRSLHRRWKTGKGGRARAPTRDEQKTFYKLHRFSGPAKGSESAMQRKSNRRKRRELPAPFRFTSQWHGILESRGSGGWLAGFSRWRWRHFNARQDLKRSSEDIRKTIKAEVKVRLNRILKRRRKRETRQNSYNKSQKRSQNSSDWIDSRFAGKKRNPKCKEWEVLASTQGRSITGGKLKVPGEFGEDCQSTEQLPLQAGMVSSSCEHSRRYANQSLHSPAEETPLASRLNNLVNHRHQENKTMYTIVPSITTEDERGDQRTRRELRNLFSAPNITYRCSPSHKYWLFASSVPMGIYPARVKVLQSGNIIRLFPAPGKEAGVVGETGEADIPPPIPPPTAHHRSDIPPEEEYTELKSNDSDAHHQQSPQPASTTSPSLPSPPSPSTHISPTSPPPPPPPAPPPSPSVYTTPSTWINETLAKVKTVVDSILQSIGSASEELERKRNERQENANLNLEERGAGRRPGTGDVPQEERFRRRNERRRRIANNKGSRRRKMGIVETPSDADDGENENNAENNDNLNTEGENYDGEAKDERGRGRRAAEAEEPAAAVESPGGSLSKISSYKNNPRYKVEEESMTEKGAPHPSMMENGAPHPSMMESGAPHPSTRESGAPHRSTRESGAPHHSTRESGAPHYSMRKRETPQHSMRGREASLHSVREKLSPHHPLRERVPPHHPLRERVPPHHPLRERVPPHHSNTKRRRRPAHGRSSVAGLHSNSTKVAKSQSNFTNVAKSNSERLFITKGVTVPRTVTDSGITSDSDSFSSSESDSSSIPNSDIESNNNNISISVNRSVSLNSTSVTTMSGTTNNGTFTFDHKVSAAKVAHSESVPKLTSQSESSTDGEKVSRRDSESAVRRDGGSVYARQSSSYL